MDDLITHAGGENLAAIHGITGPANLSPEQVLAMNPEVMFSSADSLETHAGLPASSLHPALQETDALRHGRTFTLPRRSLVTISQFIVDGVEELARLLHATDLGAGEPR
jgi:iron complex transport system substrate-binding protein